MGKKVLKVIRSGYENDYGISSIKIEPLSEFRLPEVFKDSPVYSPDIRYTYILLEDDVAWEIQSILTEISNNGLKLKRTE